MGDASQGAHIVIVEFPQSFPQHVTPSLNEELWDPTSKTVFEKSNFPAAWTVRRDGDKKKKKPQN